jgi:hypothetical protein
MTEEEIQIVEFEELLDEWEQQNKIYSYEQPRNFTKLINALDSNYHTIEDFLEDNPGALSALRDWIAEQNVSHWHESIADELVLTEE